MNFFFCVDIFYIFIETRLQNVFFFWNILNNMYSLLFLITDDRSDCFIIYLLWKCTVAFMFTSVFRAIWTNFGAWAEPYLGKASVRGGIFFYKIKKSLKRYLGSFGQKKKIKKILNSFSVTIFYVSWGVEFLNTTLGPGPNNILMTFF